MPREHAHQIEPHFTVEEEETAGRVAERSDPGGPPGRTKARPERGYMAALAVRLSSTVS